MLKEECVPGDRGTACWGAGVTWVLWVLKHSSSTEINSLYALGVLVGEEVSSAHFEKASILKNSDFN